MTDATTPESTTDPGDVQAQLAMMKGEIDALQVTVAETTKPWYKQASILIAALALLFSFGTTYYSAEQTRKADIHNAKVELRELIQQLTELPQRNVNLNSKYAWTSASRSLGQAAFAAGDLDRDEPPTRRP
jgi:hypothetical protein